MAMNNMALSNFFRRVLHPSKRPSYNQRFITTKSITNTFEFLTENSSGGWKALLRNGYESTALPDSTTLEERMFPNYEQSFIARKLADRLGMELKHGYFAQRFRQLSLGCESSSSWPGILALTFLHAAEHKCSKASSKLDYRCPSSCFQIAKAANYLYSNLIFHEELFSSYADRSSHLVAKDLVHDYFIVSSMQMIGHLKNWEVFKDFSSLLTSQVIRKLMMQRRYQKIVRNINEWEFECSDNGGVIAATACKSMLRISGSSKGMQELGYQFTRLFHMAVMAQSEIQHVFDYGKRLRSCFKISSLPVTLHLEQKPQLCILLNKLRNRMDNIDLYNVYAEIHSSSSITRAKLQLEEYIQALTIILNELPSSSSTKNLKTVINTLSQLKE